MEKRGDGTSLYGTLIRLAWHASGTYSKVDKSGGSDGARMRFNPEASWGANAGLLVARDALEPVKAKFPGLSYADLYTFGGVVAVEECGGPDIKYQAGREDAESGETSPPDGRLPDADKGSRVKTIQHVRGLCKAQRLCGALQVSVSHSELTLCLFILYPLCAIKISSTEWALTIKRLWPCLERTPWGVAIPIAVGTGALGKLLHARPVSRGRYRIFCVCVARGSHALSLIFQDQR